MGHKHNSACNKYESKDMNISLRVTNMSLRDINISLHVTNMSLPDINVSLRVTNTILWDKDTSACNKYESAAHSACKTA